MNSTYCVKGLCVLNAFKKLVQEDSKLKSAVINGNRTNSMQGLKFIILLEYHDKFLYQYNKTTIIYVIVFILK